MAKNDITPANQAQRIHEQKRGRGYRVSMMRTPSAGIFVCQEQGFILSRKLEKISTARRVLRRVQRRVPAATFVYRESLVGTLCDMSKLPQ